MSDKEQDNLFENNDDEFGLPEVSYDPINREKTGANYEDQRYYADEQGSDNKKKIWITIGLLAIALLIIGGLVYFLGFNDPKPDPPVLTTTEQAPPKKQEPEPEPEIVEEPEPETSMNTYSDVTMLSSRTGRSYIVIGSFVDEDLAKDYSNKLLADGKGSVIIEPFGKTQLLHRVAIADFSSFQEAMAEVDQYRNTYGPEAWVLKY